MYLISLQLLQPFSLYYLNPIRYKIVSICQWHDIFFYYYYHQSLASMAMNIISGPSSSNSYGYPVMFACLNGLLFQKSWRAVCVVSIHTVK